MNIKMFLFWSSIVTVGIIVAYVLIEWLKTPALALVQKHRRKIGFHVIEAKMETEVVAV